jgi:hypothetical protein
MNPLKIGACLMPHEIEDHRNWLFDADRDIELQGFSLHKDLTTEFEDRISAARKAGKTFFLIILQSAHRVFSMPRIHPPFRQCSQIPCPVRSLRLVLTARRPHRIKLAFCPC